MQSKLIKEAEITFDGLMSRWSGVVTMRGLLSLQTVWVTLTLLHVTRDNNCSTLANIWFGSRPGPPVSLRRLTDIYSGGDDCKLLLTTWSVTRVL